jgi:hypothetical protein
MVMSASTCHAEDGAFACRELGERLLTQAADGLAAPAARLDDTRRAEPAEMPRDERLRQADVGDQLGDGGVTVGKPADDAKTIDVGHDLVEGTQLAQVVGLDDGRGDRAADPGGRGRQGLGLRFRLVRGGTSTTVYINLR